MKRDNTMTRLLSIILLLLLSIGCESNRIIGSQDAMEITNVSFTTDNLYTTGTSLNVEGTLTNNNSYTIYPPFYIEALFYTDNTSQVVLGGSSDCFNYPIEPGVSTLWSLEYSSDDINESYYPDFSVNSIRIYTNQ
jgi:hypothetical protein